MAVSETPRSRGRSSIAAVMSTSDRAIAAARGTIMKTFVEIV
jgi:hypothetical protein